MLISWPQNLWKVSITQSITVHNKNSTKWYIWAKNVIAIKCDELLLYHRTALWYFITSLTHETAHGMFHKRILGHTEWKTFKHTLFSWKILFTYMLYIWAKNNDSYRARLLTWYTTEQGFLPDKLQTKASYLTSYRARLLTWQPNFLPMKSPIHLAQMRVIMIHKPKEMLPVASMMMTVRLTVMRTIPPARNKSSAAETENCKSTSYGIPVRAADAYFCFLNWQICLKHWCLLLFCYWLICL